MQNAIESISLSKLTANPANPNRMSKSNFAKLVAHIERTGRYEPIIIHPHPQKQDKYEIINGHHRCEALRRLGHSKAQCIVWDVDKAEVDMLLVTLNRLAGHDDIHKRSELIQRLSRRFDIRQLSRLLPENKKQIERLRELAIKKQPVLNLTEQAKQFASAVVFFLTDKQKGLLDKALATAATDTSDELSTAQRRAEALIIIVKTFLVHRNIQHG
jgi:ParB/RepB/Spo0J family partition protein